jgi:hypothetical protein
MTRNTSPISDLETLRAFDAAPKSSITETTTIRSEARLEQIMMTSPDVVVSISGATRRLSQKRMRAIRWAAIPVAAAAALGIGIILPNSPTLAPAHASLASWRADPTALVGAQFAVADQNCRARLADTLMKLGEGSFDLGDGTYEMFDPEFTAGQDSAGLTPIASEQRGDWAFLAYARQTDGPVLLPGDVTEVLTCLAWLPADGEAQVQQMHRLLNRSWGSDIVMWQNDEIIANANSLGNGSGGDNGQPMLVGEALLTDGTAFSTLVGTVDGDVSKLVLHTETSGDVAATINDGWYVAWWPSNWGGDAPTLPDTVVVIDTVDGGHISKGNWAPGRVGIADGATITRTDGRTENIRLDFGR